MWTFRIKTGQMLKPDGSLLGRGYSGFREGANNIKMMAVKAIGPIPIGKYTIGAAYKHAKLGPVCMNLEPDAANEMFGRSAFRIHGDNSTPDPHDGSWGCIVLSRIYREEISQSSDRQLVVTP